MPWRRRCHSVIVPVGVCSSRSKDWHADLVSFALSPRQGIEFTTHDELETRTVGGEVRRAPEFRYVRTRELKQCLRRPVQFDGELLECPEVILGWFRQPSQPRSFPQEVVLGLTSTLSLSLKSPATASIVCNLANVKVRSPNARVASVKENLV